jgi:hypothetical protein
MLSQNDYPQSNVKLSVTDLSYSWICLSHSKDYEEGPFSVLEIMVELLKEHISSIFRDKE